MKKLRTILAAFIAVAGIFTMGCSNGNDSGLSDEPANGTTTGTKEYTQAELLELLNDESKSSVFESILSGKNASELLEKLSAEKKAELFDKMAEDSTFLSRLTQIQVDSLAGNASAEKKAEIFDSLLASKTSVDFVKEILNKTENAELRTSIKNYLVAELTQAELVTLLDAKDTTKPGTVTNLTAGNTGASVKLSWTDATDTDVLAYEITYTSVETTRSVNFAENSIVIPQGTGHAYISGLINGRTYTFSVKTIDKTGNKSEAVQTAVDVRDIAVGDFILKDGNGTTFLSKETNLTDAQKANVVAIVCGFNANGVKLGLGLKQSGSLAWAPSGTTGNNTIFEGIVASSDKRGNGSASTATISGDTDGSDNWEYVKSIDPTGTQNAAENYPAFNYAANYGTTAGFAGTPFATGWYMPSIAELQELWKKKDVLNASLEKAGGNQFIAGYWSSSQESKYSECVWTMIVSNGDIDNGIGFNGNKYVAFFYVCCIRAF